MSWSSSLRSEATSPKRDKTKFKGVRRRKWGKWVSEIRVPGTQERLWLGTYATAEAAAVAHDVAVYCLRRPSSLDKLNFPETLSSYNVQVRDLMSPRSVQKVASDVGMDVDARNIVAAKTTSSSPSSSLVVAEEETYVSTTKKNDDDVSVVGTIADTSDMFLLDHGFGSDACWKTWSASAQDCIQNEPLSISIEDYL